MPAHRIDHGICPRYPSQAPRAPRRARRRPRRRRARPRRHRGNTPPRRRAAPTPPDRTEERPFATVCDPRTVEAAPDFLGAQWCQHGATELISTPSPRASARPASAIASRRFAGPSASGASALFAAPVNTTGAAPSYVRSSHSAVSSIVSVPWVTTTPSAPSLNCCRDRRRDRVPVREGQLRAVLAVTSTTSTSSP